MKKTLFGLCLLACSATVFANPVGLSDAQKVAEHFLEMKTGKSNVLISHFDFETTQKPDDGSALYIFTMKQQPGFVIVAGDDAVIPVLGYSLDNDFAGTKAVSPEVQYWLNGYADQIREVQHRQLKATNIVQNAWAQLLQAPATTGRVAEKATGVSPMLSTKWDQLPYYNEDCPATPNSPYNPSQHAPTGCVATAMAQIMKYWETPATTGTGSHSYSSSTVGGTLSANFGNTTYDWTDMPNKLTSNSTNTEVDAVATLMYHCGVAVEMDYDTTESGAYVINYGNANNFACSQNALPAYFGYSSAIKGYQRSQFDDSTWIAMLKYELNHGRPILYTGYGSVGGHAFDFDGYNDNGEFHINWGWGGLSNGYFTVDNLSPSALGQGAGAGNFNSGQEALIMIEPDASTLPANPYTPNGQSSIDFTLTYAQNPQATKDTIHVGEAYSVTSKIKNNGPDDFNQNDYQLMLLALNTSNHQTVTIDTRQETLQAGDTYQYGFNDSSFDDLTPGTYFMAYGYMDQAGNGDLVTDTGGVYAGVSLTVLPRNAGIENVLSGLDYKVFPNPSDKVVNVQLSAKDAQLKAVQLFDALGRLVYEDENTALNSVTISVSAIPSGMYYLKLLTSNGTKVQKVLIRH